MSNDGTVAFSIIFRLSELFNFPIFSQPIPMLGSRNSTAAIPSLYSAPSPFSSVMHGFSSLLSHPTHRFLKLSCAAPIAKPPMIFSMVQVFVCLLLPPCSLGHLPRRLGTLSLRSFLEMRTTGLIQWYAGMAGMNTAG